MSDNIFLNIFSALLLTSFTISLFVKKQKSVNNSMLRLFMISASVASIADVLYSCINYLPKSNSEGYIFCIASSIIWLFIAVSAYAVCFYIIMLSLCIDIIPNTLTLILSLIPITLFVFYAITLQEGKREHLWLFLVIYPVISAIIMIVKSKHFTATQYVSLAAFSVSALYCTESILSSKAYTLTSLESFSAILLYTAYTAAKQPLIASEEKSAGCKQENTDEAAEAKDVFLANVSHEIRTPVNSMLGMSQMILRKSFDDEIRNYALTAEKSGRTLLELTNNLIDYTSLRSDSIKCADEVYSVRPFLEKIIRETEFKLDGKPIQLITDISPSLPTALRGDEIIIYRIISNLISNAVKFTKHGNIKLTVSSQQTDTEKIILTASVEDSGCGIKDDKLPDIFNCFAQYEELPGKQVEGVGLGLAVTARLLKLIDGRINVKSELGKGSSFTAVIPQKIVNNAPVGNVSSSTAHSDIENSAFTAHEADVLIADDNEVNLFVLHEFLKQFGINADIADSGEECFELASKKAYDIIFLDHMMPDPDGVKTMHMIKETAGCASNAAEIVVITANAVTGVKEKYISEGFSDYLSKPVEFGFLAKSLMSHLPKEKIIYNFAEAQQLNTETIFSIENISHINTAAGLNLYSDNRANYFKALADYAHNAGNYAAALEDAYIRHNMVAYAVAASEIRTASFNIGAENLADMAKFQEMFASSDKYEDVTALHLDFMNAFVAVTAEAAKICAENSPELIDLSLFE